MGSSITVGHIPRRNARLYPNKTCIYYKDKEFTYDQFNRRVNRQANALMGLNVKKGDRVAFLSFNCHHSVEIKFALGKIGAVEVPLNFYLDDNEVVCNVNDAEAVVFISGREFGDMVASIRSKLTGVKHFVSVGGVGGMPDWETITSSASDEEPKTGVAEDDVFIQMYTSGTTGKPKGCMLTHRNIIEAIYGMTCEWRLSEDDVLLVAQPIFHIASAGKLFAVLFAGGAIVIQQDFKPLQFLEDLQKYHATFSGLSHLSARTLLSYPDLHKYDLSSLRFFITASEPDLVRKAGQVLGCDIYEYYGSTETTANVAFHNHTRTQFRKGNSCGREARNVEVRIVDDNGKEVPAGDVGEIVVKGACNMKGYWKLPEETSNTIKEDWVYTGDMGYMDEERYLYIVGRKTDVIYSGGGKIYCKEVEDTLYTHPFVNEAAVIGIPDGHKGEAIKAIVVTEKGTEIAARDIIEHCKKYLPGYKAPTSVDFIKSLPRTSSGKVKKTKLLQMYLKN